MFKTKFLLLVNAIILTIAAPLATQAAVCTTEQTGPYSKKIHLSEVLPNPSTTESQDEFIEIYSTDTEAVDLTGWEVRDAAGTTYTLTGTVSAGRYFAWYRADTKISLNNTGDSVTLLQPDGKEVETITYTDSAADDSSYALNSSGQWTWSETPTPFTANQFTTSSNSDNSNSSTDSSDESGDTSNPGYEYSQDVVLSELLPDPEGSDATDEWIELANQGETVNLYGWKLTDGSSDYEFPDQTLASGFYLQVLVTDSGISLNNSGETIQLLDPDGAVISEVTYDSASTGESYASLNGSWQWTTTLTPGSSNAITTADGDDQPSDDADQSNSEESTSTGTTISSVRQMAAGTEVTFSGTVLVLPDTYSSTYFYVQDETAGIQIASSSQAFPSLNVGDVVTVTGNTSSSNGEAKINVTDSNHIVVTSHVDTIAPYVVTALESAQAGRLVSLNSSVTEKSGSTITLEDGTAYIKRGTEISTSTITVGETYQWVGVVIATDDGVQLWPRSSTDITTPDASLASAFTEALVPSAQAAELDATSSTYTATTGSHEDRGSYWWIALAVTGAVLGLLIRFWQTPWLNVRLRNWIAQSERAWVKSLGRWVGLEKNTKDSSAQNQYRESHTSDKTIASASLLNLPSAAKYAPTLNPPATVVGIPVPITSRTQNTL